MDIHDGPIRDTDPEAGYDYEPRLGLPLPDDEALEELRRDVADLDARISGAIHTAVEKAMGVPSNDSPDWHRRLELRHDRDHQRTHYLTAIQVADLLNRDVSGFVTNAVRYGASWSQIGSALGITKQSAHGRFPFAKAEAAHLRASFPLPDELGEDPSEIVPGVNAP